MRVTLLATAMLALPAMAIADDRALYGELHNAQATAGEPWVPNVEVWLPWKPCCPVGRIDKSRPCNFEVLDADAHKVLASRIKADVTNIDDNGSGTIKYFFSPANELKINSPGDYTLGLFWVCQSVERSGYNNTETVYHQALTKFPFHVIPAPRHEPRTSTGPAPNGIGRSASGQMTCDGESIPRACNIFCIEEHQIKGRSGAAMPPATCADALPMAAKCRPPNTAMVAVEWEGRCVSVS